MTALTYSPDGRALLTSGFGKVRFLDARTLRPERALTTPFAPRIYALELSPDRRLLAVAGGTPGAAGEVGLLRWPSGEPVLRIHGFKDLATSVAFSPDGSRIAVVSADASVRLAKLSHSDDRWSLSQERTLSGHSGAVFAVTFSPDGRFLVTAGADRTLRVWSPETGALLRTLSQHTGAVHALAFRPAAEGASEPYCASGADDRTVRIWQPETGRMVRIVRGHGGPVLALRWSRGGSRLFSAGVEGAVREIDGGSDQILRTWKPLDSWIYSLALSPDGRTLAAGGWQGSVRRIDLGPTVAVLWNSRGWAGVNVSGFRGACLSSRPHDSLRGPFQGFIPSPELQSLTQSYGGPP